MAQAVARAAIDLRGLSAIFDTSRTSPRPAQKTDLHQTKSSTAPTSARSRHVRRSARPPMPGRQAVEQDLPGGVRPPTETAGGRRRLLAYQPVAAVRTTWAALQASAHWDRSGRETSAPSRNFLQKARAWPQTAGA